MPVRESPAAQVATKILDETEYDENGKMVKDSWGASGVTASLFKNYLSHIAYETAADIAPEIHMAAIEGLRVHSGTQLDRGAWEAAYNALHACHRLCAPLASDPGGQSPPVEFVRDGGQGVSLLHERAERGLGLRRPQESKISPP